MSGELSFVSTSGNTSTQTLGVGGHLTNRSGAWRSQTAVVFVRAETDDTETARTLGVDFRVVRDLTPRAGWYGHSAYHRDTFAGIEHRIGADSGLAFKVVAARSHAVDLDLGLGYTNETRSAQADRSFPAGTLALDCRWTVTETTQVTNDTALTANLRQSGDWRVANVAALSTALSRTLSLRLSYQVTFMNRAVPGFRRTDTTASAAVVAKLSR
jgi:putative salt-induced outer membrane protein YdiY